MANEPSPTGLGGLPRFDLPIVFRCAVELAEAASNLAEQEWADLPANYEGPKSPSFERRMEASRRLRRIEEETERLKRSLDATGPLEFRGGEADRGPKWESYDQRFSNTSHDRIVRLALLKLATAAIDLSGFATWREWQWRMRETGLRLLAWGLAQLWAGMSENERSNVRDCLERAHQAIGWPATPATDPPAYDGPEEIPLPDQYRVVANYVSCHRDYLEDVQKAESNRVERGQEQFLCRATLVQFVETAERAGQALQALANRDFDSTAEWGDLYTRAFGLLACLRRAHEVQPRKAWPASALEQRRVLAHAAGILLTCVGGTPEAKARMNPADEDKALELFMETAELLRNAVELTRLEAQSQQPVSSTTIQQEKKATGLAPRDVARDELTLVRDFSGGLPAKSDIDAQERQGDAAPVGVYPSPFTPDGIDPFDEQEAHRAALECANAVGQLLDTAELHRCGTLITEKAILRCFYDMDRAVAHASHFHVCNATFPWSRTGPWAEATKLAKTVRSRWMKAVLEWKNRPDTPSDGWYCLWRLYQRHFANPVGPTWVDAVTRIEKSDADERGLLHSAIIYIPQEAIEHEWHLGTWPLVCERLSVFSAADVMALVSALHSKVDSQEKQNDAGTAALQAETSSALPSDMNAALALMRVFTNGIADERIEKAARLLSDGELAANEKLTEIDALIPIPATASAEQLGVMLGVSKQAVLKTGWWIQNRRGEKESTVGRRREVHQRRARSLDTQGQGDSAD